MHINLGAENVVNSPSCDMPSGVSVVKGWGFEPLPTDFEACEMHFPKRDDGNLEPSTMLLGLGNYSYEKVAALDSIPTNSLAEVAIHV